MHKYLIAAAAPIALLAGCSNPIGPGSPDSISAPLKSPQQTMDDLLAAVDAKDAAKVASFYADDAAVYVAGTGLVTGAANIAARYDEGFRNNGYKVAIDAKSSGFIARGADVAVYRAEGDWTYSANKTLYTVHMANIMVWERDKAANVWKVTSDFTEVNPGFVEPPPQEPEPNPRTPLSNPIGPGIPKWGFDGG